MNQFTDALNINISEDSEIDPKDFLEMVEKEEELLEALQEESDEESDNDEEGEEFWKKFLLAIYQCICTYVG